MSLPGGGPVRRFIWESVVALIWFSAFVGWVLFTMGASVISGILAAVLALPGVWVLLAQPLWITADVETGTVTFDFLPAGRCRQTADAHRITYETRFKRLDIDLPRAVLGRQSLQLFRPNDRDLLTALDAAGAVRITGS